MKKLLKSFLLLTALLPIILAVCPDYPTIPTTSPLMITAATEGISHFTTSTQQLSITMMIKPETACLSEFYRLFSIALTPSGGGTQQNVVITFKCNTDNIVFSTSGFGSFVHPVKNFVTITAGQFLTFPLPSISSTLPAVSYSFSFSAWVKILTDIPTATTTIFAMYSSTGDQVGYFLTVDQSSKMLSMTFKSNAYPFSTSGTAPTVALDTWQLIGFTASSNTDQKSVVGTVFCGTSWYNFRVDKRPSPYDLSTASVIRIGDASSSFNGHISVVRIMTPGGGFLKTTDLCSSDNSFELGTGSFGLACSGTNILNPADNTCLASCPNGAYKATDTGTPLCVGCSEHCTSCDSSGCLECETGFLRYDGGCVDTCPDKTYSDGEACQTCETNYLKFDGGCVKPCPDKTYSDGTACQSCSDTNCKKCDSTKCLACGTDYFLHQGGCVDPCPSKTYSTGTVCKDCSTHCKVCESSTKCKTCDASYLLYQDDCVDSCPSGTYLTGSACKDCSANCKTCDSTKCSVCNTNYLFYQGGCVASCPAKFYSDKTSCIACSSHCAKCEAGGCKVCDNGYELNGEKKCFSPSSPSPSTPSTPSTPTREEAGSSGGGISGGALAGIVCGSVTVASLIGWSIYSFNTKKFPFSNSKRTAKTHHMEKKNPFAIESSSPVSPAYTEENPLFP